MSLYTAWVCTQLHYQYYSNLVDTWVGATPQICKVLNLIEFLLFLEYSDSKQIWDMHCTCNACTCLRCAWSQVYLVHVSQLEMTRSNGQQTAYMCCVCKCQPLFMFQTSTSYMYMYHNLTLSCTCNSICL